MLLAALLCGCSSIELPESLNPLYDPPAPSSVSIDPAPNLSVPRRIAILDTPRQLMTESVYPPFLTRQKLVWDGDGMEWRMRFPTRQYAYATFVLKQPINLQAYHNDMKLVFRFRPARLAAFLSVALLDRPVDATPALSDVWLLDHAPPAGDGWTTVSIPLSAFPHGTLTSDQPLEEGAEPAAQPALNRELDWARIQEVRFVSQGGRIPAEEIVVRDVRLQRL